MRDGLIVSGPPAVAVATADGSAHEAFWRDLGFTVSGPRRVADARRWRVRLPVGSVKIDEVLPAPAIPPVGAAGYAEVAVDPPDERPWPDDRADGPDGVRTTPAGDGALAVTIRARDVHGLDEYYRAVGFVADEGGRLVLGRLALRLEETTTEHAAPGRATAGIRYVTVVVDDVDAAVARCVDAGASIEIRPLTVGSVRFAIVADPEGNWMELGAEV